MSERKVYKVRSKVWLYPGMAGWHFVNVDKKQSEVIREKYGKSGRGFGSIPVEVTLGKTVWKTSIFPEKRSTTYILPLKQKVRTAEDVFVDDTISLSIKLL